MSDNMSILTEACCSALPGPGLRFVDEQQQKEERAEWDKQEKIHKLRKRLCARLREGSLIEIEKATCWAKGHQRRNIQAGAYLVVDITYHSPGSDHGHPSGYSGYSSVTIQKWVGKYNPRVGKYTFVSYEIGDSVKFCIIGAKQKTWT